MNRGKRYKSTMLDKEKRFYIIGVGFLTVLIIFIFALSGYKAKKEANAKIAQIESEENFDATMVSSTEDKSINEVENKAEEKIAINTSNITNNTVNQIKETPTPEVKETPKPVELHFSVPLEGEIAKDFSDSNLTYSETLQEWTVHLGVDIKAEKGSSVLASEAGTVESIKNDPRYGITVVIEHSNGYSSVYSNLLTAEFVKEKEKVKKGQTIGTVGNTATFEIADEAHLHFEILKNNEYVDPSQYIK